MKTCSTCKHKKTQENDNKGYFCKKYDHWFMNKMGKLVSCESYDDFIEPLRLECECGWDEHATSGIIYPSCDGDILKTFKGKRTKMTIEEIL